MWFVYCLENKQRDFLYIGSTNDIKRRMKEHVQGMNRATKSYRPLDLTAYIAVSSKRKARQLERYFKTGSGILLRSWEQSSTPLVIGDSIETTLDPISRNLSMAGGSCYIETCAGIDHYSYLGSAYGSIRRKFIENGWMSLGYRLAFIYQGKRTPIFYAGNRDRFSYTFLFWLPIADASAGLGLRYTRKL